MKKMICCFLAFLFLAGCASQPSGQNTGEELSSSGVGELSSQASSVPTPQESSQASSEPTLTEGFEYSNIEKLNEYLQQGNRDVSAFQFISPNQLLLASEGDCIVFDLGSQSLEIQQLSYSQYVQEMKNKNYTQIDTEQNKVLYFDPNGNLLRETSLTFSTQFSLDDEKGHLIYPTAISTSQKKAIFLQETDPLSPLVFELVDAEDGTITEKTADISGIFETEELVAMLPDQELLKDIRYRSVRFLNDDIVSFEIWFCKAWMIQRLCVLYNLKTEQLESFQTGDFSFFYGQEDQVFILSNTDLTSNVYQTEGHTVWRVDFESSPVKLVPCGFEAQELSFSANGKYLLGVYTDGGPMFSATVRDAATLQELYKFEFPKTESMNDIVSLWSAISGDGKSYLFEDFTCSDLTLIQKSE